MKITFETPKEIVIVQELKRTIKEINERFDDETLEGNNNFSIFCKKNFFFLTSKYNFSAITEPNLKKFADDCGRLNRPPN